MPNKKETIQPLITSDALPLAGINVLEMSTPKSSMCGRLLADLGAEVILVEPAINNLARTMPPVVDGRSLHFETHNSNKNSIVLDLNNIDDRNKLFDLSTNTDLFIDSPNTDRSVETTALMDKIRKSHPELIVLSITDFGLTGPYKDFQATNAVHLTLGGVVARSGISGMDPLLPPGDMAIEAAAIQATLVALIALYQRQRNGQAGLLDFSIFEATAQLIDPGLGVTGSAAGGKTAAQLAHKGRPKISPFYPILPCHDGFVRLCILNPRQWQGMCEWLGPDHPFTDPAYGSIRKRFSAIKEINQLIAALFANKNGKDLVAEGQQRGIPMATLATPTEVLNDAHFQARGAFTNLEMTKHSTGKWASGYLEIDRHRIGVRTPAPALPTTHDHSLGFTRAKKTNSSTQGENSSHSFGRPLAGIRVLDLGVIVAGAELGRLLSDQGADVIKIENRTFADGLRQSHDGSLITPSFAQGSRGKRSMGLNLRDPKGIAIFKQLVEKSDIIISNFKPGTMASLGLDYTTLRALNPSIIMADSSALGNSGPLSKSMGYGPLVRAASGLSGLWCYPHLPDSGFSDGITIYPDHFAARVSAVGIIASLIRRQNISFGGEVSVSQAETILNAMATDYLYESLCPNTMQRQGNQEKFHVPSNLFSCAETDDWCYISVSNETQWENLCNAIKREDLLVDERYNSAAKRQQHRAFLESILQDWCRQYNASTVMTTLQKLGVAAAKMFRIEELADNPHLKDRNFFRSFSQPGIETPLITENGPVGISYLPDPDIKPAPYLGEHTIDIAKNILKLSENTIEQYIDEGILEIFDTDESTIK